MSWVKIQVIQFGFCLFLKGQRGFLKYQDISTGKVVADLRTGLGPCDCMVKNPYNAIINLGHCRGENLMK